jgi:hypothetical protein
MELFQVAVGRYTLVGLPDTLIFPGTRLHAAPFLLAFLFDMLFVEYKN